MALNFEFEKTINTNSQPFISYNDKSKLSNYSIKVEKQVDSSADAQYGQYDNVSFSGSASSITNKKVTRIGGKNIPGIGTMAFYKDAITGNCYIVNVTNYLPPTLVIAEQVQNKLHIKITPPNNVYYDCYRLLLEQIDGDFASEFILYNYEEYIEIPLVKGSYSVYCFGYDEINGIISPLSNVIELDITTGLNSWKPYSEEFNSNLLSRIANIESDINDIQEEIDGVSNLVDDLNGEVI